jgi:hypothetical protein
MKATELYDRDFVLWAEENAGLLRAGRIQDADLPHIAEEIGDMGKERQHALKSHLRALLSHLLKHQFQPSRRSTSWLRTIANARAEIEDLLEENPSLAPLVAPLAVAPYPRSAKLAAIETKLPASRFPARCPYTVKQIRDDAYLA